MSFAPFGEHGLANWALALPFASSPSGKRVCPKLPTPFCHEIRGLTPGLPKEFPVAWPAQAHYCFVSLATPIAGGVAEIAGTPRRG